MDLDFSIDDPLEIAQTAGIEVTIRFQSGETRWCFFMTPAALAECGDLVGTARVHLGERHMIVVSDVTREVIEEVLSGLHARGELESRTLPLRAPLMKADLERVIESFFMEIPGFTAGESEAQLRALPGLGGELDEYIVSLRDPDARPEQILMVAAGLIDEYVNAKWDEIMAEVYALYSDLHRQDRVVRQSGERRTESAEAEPTPDN